MSAEAEGLGLGVGVAVGGGVMNTEEVATCELEADLTRVAVAGGVAPGRAEVPEGGAGMEIPPATQSTYIDKLGKIML